MTVLNSVREIIMLPVNGITSSAQPVISFNYGAALLERVRKAIVFLTGLLFVYSTLMWGIVSLFPHFFISIFNTDPQLLAAGVPSMHLYFFGFCFMAFQFSAQSVFTALGKSHQAIFFSIFRKVIVVIPLTLLLPHIAALGVNGVFLAEPISNLLGGAASFTTMYFTVYRQLKNKSDSKKESDLFFYSSITSKSSGTYKFPLKYGWPSAVYSSRRRAMFLSSV